MTLGPGLGPMCWQFVSLSKDPQTRSPSSPSAYCADSGPSSPLTIHLCPPLVPPAPWTPRTLGSVCIHVRHLCSLSRGKTLPWEARSCDWFCGTWSSCPLWTMLGSSPLCPPIRTFFQLNGSFVVSSLSSDSISLYICSAPLSPMFCSFCWILSHVVTVLWSINNAVTCSLVPQFKYRIEHPLVYTLNPLLCIL